MRMLTALVALCSTLLGLGCAADDMGEPIVDLGDTEDRLGRNFRVRATEVRYPPTTGFRGTLQVAKAEGPDEDVNEVRGVIYLLDVPDEGTVRIKADEHGAYDHLSKDMEFILLSSAGNNVWQRIELFFEHQNESGDNALYNPNSLDELIWTPNRNNDQPPRAIAENDEFDEITRIGNIGLESVGPTIGVLVIPRKVWGNIRGDYDYKLEVDCSGRVCVNPDNAELADQDNAEPGADDEGDSEPKLGAEAREDRAFDGENPSYTDDILGGHR